MKRQKTREELLADLDNPNPIWGTSDIAAYCDLSYGIALRLVHRGVFRDAKVMKRARFIPGEVVAAWADYIGGESAHV